MAGRRPHWQRIKRHRSYEVSEAARALGVAKGTVRRWLDNGLPALTDQRPLLILGSELLRFGEERRKPKQKCGLTEWYCLSCKAPRLPAFNEAEFISSGRANVNLRALCCECATVMHKRVSPAQLAAIRREVAVNTKQAETRISDSPHPCLIDHFDKEPETDA